MTVLTLVQINDSAHLMKSLDATFCGLPLDRELRRTCVDRVDEELEVEGALICYACQRQRLREGDS